MTDCGPSESARVGVVVHLDDEPVRADRRRPPGQGRHHVPPAGAVRGVHQDRQVREPLHRRHHREVQRVAGEVREGPHPALAQDDLVVPLGQDVLGRHQELLEGRGEAALEEHRLPRLAAPLEQREVLHVPGAHLDGVGVALHDVDALDVERLRHHRQARLLAGGGEDPQPLLAQALEGVRARARLEGPAPQQARPSRLDAARHGERLLERLDRARAGRDHELPAAHRHVPDVDDRVLRLHLAGDELVGVGDGDDLEDAGQALEDGSVDRPPVAGDADGRALRAGDRVGLEAAGLDRPHDTLDLLRLRVLPHHHEHRLGASRRVRGKPGCYHAASRRLASAAGHPPRRGLQGRRAGSVSSRSTRSFWRASSRSR